MEHFFQNIGEDWFTYPNLYKHVVDKFTNDSHFVEIGSWKGRSACYLGVEIVNSGKNIKFDCVDLWIVTEDELIDSSLDLSLSKDDNLYKTFINNIQPLKDIINPIRNSSVNASSLYEDNSLDFVFIDAGHDYKSVKEDIEHWFNKVKTGGIIAGHDCYLPDVHQAVTEYFGNDIQISESCWIFYKN